MGDNSEASRARAEARFVKIKKAADEGAAVWAQYEASRQAVRDRTAALKEMRLANETRLAKEAAEAALAKPAPKRKTKQPVGA